jgi:hypothetical protein
VWKEQAGAREALRVELIFDCASTRSKPSHKVNQCGTEVRGGILCFDGAVEVSDGISDVSDVTAEVDSSKR